MTKEYFFEESMNDSLNPFDSILENPEYPLARIYRESFWTSIGDTYDVIVGNHYRGSMYKPEPTHLGFLDILIFPLIAQWLMKIAFPEKKAIKEIPDKQKDEVLSSIPLPIRILAGGLAGLLEGLRGTVGILLTLAVLPIVTLVHIFMSFKANSLKEQVKNLKVESEKLGKYDQRKDGYLRYEETESLGSSLSRRCSLSSNELAGIRYSPGENKYIINKGGMFEWSFTFFKSKNKSEVVEAFNELNIGAKRVR